MDQNNNYITIEMNLRIQMKDYRLVLGVRKIWIITLIVAAAQLTKWAFGVKP